MLKIMDVRLLFDQYTKFSLSIISPSLFELTNDKSVIYFHDEEKSDLFFIRLNEFLNTSFTSPYDKKSKTTLFKLMEQFCIQYKEIDDFNKFLQTIKETEKYFFKKRFYKYYISPYDIDFEISFAELINFQSNYSKHSYYHLNIIQDKLKKHFKKNNIPDFENEDYNEHLTYFKEAVLDDRLNFNQTHIVEKLVELFLSYWEILHSNHQNRILDLIYDFIKKNGRLVQWKIDKPNNLTEIEEFYWSIKGINKFPKNRLLDYLPNTWKPLIEKESSIGNFINKNR